MKQPFKIIVFPVHGDFLGGLLCLQPPPPSPQTALEYVWSLARARRHARTFFPGQEISNQLLVALQKYLHNSPETAFHLVDITVSLSNSFILSLISPICTYFPCYFSSVCQLGLGTVHSLYKLSEKQISTLLEAVPLLRPHSSTASFTIPFSPLPLLPPSLLYNCQVQSHRAAADLHAFFTSSGVASWWLTPALPWTAECLSHARSCHGLAKKARISGITTDLPHLSIVGKVTGSAYLRSARCPCGTASVRQTPCGS